MSQIAHNESEMHAYNRKLRPGRVLRSLTYSNVMSTLAVVLVVGGGTAWAISLPKNSVKSKNIKDGQVMTADLANGAVTSQKLGGAGTNQSLGAGSVSGANLAADSVDSSKVKDGSLQAADVNPSALPAKNLGATTKNDASTALANTSSPDPVLGVILNEGLSADPDQDARYLAMGRVVVANTGTADTTVVCTLWDDPLDATFSPAPVKLDESRVVLEPTSGTTTTTLTLVGVAGAPTLPGFVPPISSRSLLLSCGDSGGAGFDATATFRRLVSVRLDH